MVKIFFNEFLIRSWWVWLFALLCKVGYDWAIERQHREQMSLEAGLLAHHVQLEFVQKEHEELAQRLESQSDVAWIEMVLMQGLGVVPEGQTKVYFSPTKTQP